MTASDVAVIADAVSALWMVATALLVARLTDITSVTSNASRDGADDGQKISGRRKGARNDNRYSKNQM